MSFKSESRQISLVLPAGLLHKVDESSKAHCVTRADYIRRALARETQADENRVEKMLTRYLDPAQRELTQAEKDEALLKSLGIDI